MNDDTTNNTQQPAPDTTSGALPIKPIKSKRKYTRKSEDKPDGRKKLPQAFKPGQSGNINGRPKGSQNYKTIVQEGFIQLLQSQVKDKQGKEKEFFQAFNETFKASALDPKSVAFKFLAERLYSDNILTDIEKSIMKTRTSDLDFLLYRIRKRAFDIQTRVLDSQSKDICLLAGRRSGKSESIKLRGLQDALKAPKQRILIIGMTVMKTVKIYMKDMCDILEEIGIEFRKSETEANIILFNESFVQFAGNSSKLEREKFRGQHYDLIVVDEAQSQTELGMFIKEIINPMLLDSNGTLILAGSGPRTRGTYFESFWSNPSPSGLRLNWNLSMNPHIHDYQNALATVREKYGLSETDSLYIREYLGQIAYDDQALVFRTKDDNYFTDADITAWIQSQPRADIKFVAGLDYGFRDADAFNIIMYSEGRNEKFLVYEYIASGTDVTTLLNAVKYGQEYIATNPLFAEVPYKKFDIYSDTNEQKITTELSVRYGVPIFNAIKHDKSLAIQQLQEELRKGNLKIRKEGQTYQDFLRIIFKRIELEGQPSIITREIDDEVFHSDTLDALLYSLRNYWITHAPDHYVAPAVGPDTTNTNFWDTYQMPENDSNLF